MTSRAPVIIAVNYHRIGNIDPGNPLHRLHTIAPAVFAEQVAHMRQLGRIVSLAQARAARDLADVNFVLCFDDVPISAAPAISTLTSAGTPVTVSVCGRLATDGWGSRDKVYAIEKFCSPTVIAEHVAARTPELARLGLDFYHLTKSDAADPGRIDRELVDPLFDTIADQAGAYFAEPGYLLWPQVRQLASNPLVTLANHTFSHRNLAALTAGALEREIAVSHLTFAKHLGQPPRWFTVPFGRFTQELALDLIPALKGLGYHGVLWVGAAGTTIGRRYRHQLLQLTRLHAEPTAAGFSAQVEQAVETAGDAAIWRVAATPHTDAVTVVASSDPGPSIAAEMVLRQGKDYSADPRFYAYQFTTNPFKGSRPDYYAVLRDGRIEATAYNFHTRFCLDGVKIPGVYLSSWRKLPHAHRTAAARLLQKMLASEAIVGVYRPNPAIAAAFARWHRVPVHHLTLPASGPCPPPDGYDLSVSTTWPDEAESLVRTSVHRAGFTVARDGIYQQWRHGTYPLARCRYLLVRCGGHLAAVAVLLQGRQSMSIADFHLADGSAGPALLQSVMHLAAEQALTVTVETSDPGLAAHAQTLPGAQAEVFSNYYHFNTALLTHLGIGATTLMARLDGLAFHETATTSDVLIR